MRKPVLLVGAALVAALAAALWFAAEESYVLRLNATLGTALDVDKHGEVRFGNVYGQEERAQTVRVALSHHAQNDDNLASVRYSATCTPGFKQPGGPFLTPEGKLLNFDDVCQYTTLTPAKPLGGFFTLVNDGVSAKFIDHTLAFVFPDCAGSTANPAKAITGNCNQDTSVRLDGTFRVLRVAIDHPVKKIECLEKDDPATWDPRCFE